VGPEEVKLKEVRENELGGPLTWLSSMIYVSSIKNIVRAKAYILSIIKKILAFLSLGTCLLSCSCANSWQYNNIIQTYEQIL
jgi:hypothetical protein